MVIQEKAAGSNKRCVACKSGTEMIVLMFVFLMRGLRETEGMSLTESQGQKVTITCSHSNAHSNIKYFCKERCTYEDILVRTDGKTTSEKYSISDEGNTFYVTISDLTEDDSGTYWCGVERIGKDTYKKVVLQVLPKVVEGSRKARNGDAPQSADDTTASSSMTLVYIGTGLGVVLLTLAVVLFTFFRYRSRSRSRSSRPSCGKVSDTVYATPLHQKRDEQGHISSSPRQTAKKDEGTDEKTAVLGPPSAQHQDGGRDQNIYSNVSLSSETQVQGDGLCYSTVSFSKQAADSPVDSCAVTYSAITYPPAEESPLYCNV